MYDGTCCIDKLHTLLPHLDIKEYINVFIEISRRRKLMKILPVLNRKMRASFVVGLSFMIGKCSNTSSPHYVSCNYLYNDDDVPVYDRYGLVYRNHACAMCHQEQWFR